MASGPAAPAGGKQHLRLPLRSPAPLIAGILLMIFALATLIATSGWHSLGMVSTRAFFFWRVVSWPISAVDWRLGTNWPFEPLWWISGLLSLVTAGLLLLAVVRRNLQGPAVIVAGICLALHPVIWALQLNWTLKNVGLQAYQMFPQVTVLLIAGVIIGALFIVAAVAPLDRTASLVLKIAVIAAIGLEFIWLIPTFSARLGRSYTPPILVPFAIFLVAMIVLAGSLSSDPAKMYDQPKPSPVFYPPAPWAMPQQTPMYAPVAMPGVAQPVPTPQPASTPGAPHN